LIKKKAFWEIWKSSNNPRVFFEMKKVIYLSRDLEEKDYL